jgi:RNA polymerase sigma factor (sigma-70 family)
MAEAAITTSGAGAERPTPPATGAMSFGLSIAGLLFLYGTVLQLLVVAWLGAGALLSASAGMALVHSGELAPAPFARSATLAAGLDGVLLFGIFCAWVARRAPKHGPAEETGLYEKHPVPLTAMGLLAALGAVTAALGDSSSSAAHRVTTVVVMANAYFFALLAFVWSIVIVHACLTRFQRWTLASAYRTGAWTMLFALAGVAGMVLRKAEWYAAPLAELREDVDLEPLLHADGVIDFQEKALCIAAGEAIEAGASGTLAPACALVLEGGSGAAAGSIGGAMAAAGFGAMSGGGTDDDSARSSATTKCFETLHPKLPTARAMLLRLGLGAYDADDTAMAALLETCTRQPPPENLVGYFVSVSRHATFRAKQKAIRHVAWDDATFDSLQIREHCNKYSPPESLEVRERELSRVWQAMLDTVDEHTADVIRSRLVHEMSFREVGEHTGVSEREAKDTFHNAIRRLRKRRAECVL